MRARSRALATSPMIAPLSVWPGRSPESGPPAQPKSAATRTSTFKARKGRFKRSSPFQARRPPSTVLDFPRELPARGIDIAAACLARRGDDPGAVERLAEALDDAVRRAHESGVRKRIERNQVDLTRY